MALSGNDLALMQARSGIARSGATRSNYYRGAGVIEIDVDGVPTDLSKYVLYNQWTVSLNINDNIDTATFALGPDTPFVPQTRAQVRIGLGTTTNLLFAGIILTVQRTRRPGPDPRFWYNVTCVDWTALLDAHLVVAEYPAQSVTTTILDIIARFTHCGIQTFGVPPGLPSIAGFSVANERPSTVLRRITNKIGGGFYLDATRTLRAWSSTIPSPIQDGDPTPLTDNLPSLKQFRMTEDASQQRTRVFAEGKRTSTLLGVPALPLNTLPEIPVAEGNVITQYKKVRLGTQLGDTPLAYSPGAVSGNPPGTVLVTTNLLIGSTNMIVESTALFRQQGGWCQVASQVVRYAVIDATNFQIPGSGYGALQAPVAVGAQIIDLPWFTFDATDRPVTPAGPQYPFSRVTAREQPKGTPAVLVVWAADDAAAAVIAQREGSDGYHEHIVQDGRYNAAGADARAAAELADFAQPTVAYEWETEDLNAAPGRMQTIALVEGTPVSATVRITNVVVTPIVTGYPPRRQVKATKIQTAGVVDIWVDDAL